MYRIIFSLIVACVPLVSLAQEAATSTDESSVFAESIEIDAGVLQYSETADGDLVLTESWHDTNGDERIDAWFVYDTDTVVRESYDTNGDEVPDLVLTVDEAGAVTEIGGPDADTVLRTETEPFVPEPIDINYGDGRDLVGDLSDISIDEPNNGWIFFVLLFLVGGIVYLFWQRQQ